MVIIITSALWGFVTVIGLTYLIFLSTYKKLSTVRVLEVILITGMAILLFYNTTIIMKNYNDIKELQQEIETLK